MYLYIFLIWEYIKVQIFKNIFFNNIDISFTWINVTFNWGLYKF